MKLLHYKNKYYIFAIILLFLFWLAKNRYDSASIYIMGKEVVVSVVEKKPRPSFVGYIPRGFPRIDVRYQDSLYNIRIAGPKYRKLTVGNKLVVFFDSETKQLMEQSVGKSHISNLIFILIAIFIFIIYFLISYK